MKKLIKILLREALDEARSVKGNISKDENLGELLTHIYDKYGFKNTFLSFRDTQHVGKINPDNKYNTPTGLYTYNLSNFIDSPILSMENFTSKFPFASDREHLQFLVTNDSINLLDSNYDKSKLDGYVKQIQSKFGNIDPVNGLCERWLTDDYQSYYSEAKHPTHKFWLFVYDVVPYAYPNGQKNNSFAIICRALGIDGFHDDKCEGWIHPSEKCQTVFFRSGIFQDEFSLESRVTKNNNLYLKHDQVTPDSIIKLISQNRIDIREPRFFKLLITHSDNETIRKYVEKYLSELSVKDVEHLFFSIKEDEEREQFIKLALNNVKLVSRIGIQNIGRFLGRSENSKEHLDRLLNDKNFINSLPESPDRHEIYSILGFLKYIPNPVELFKKLGDLGGRILKYFNDYHDVDPDVLMNIMRLFKYTDNPEEVMDLFDNNPYIFIDTIDHNERFYDFIAGLKYPYKMILMILKNKKLTSMLMKRPRNFRTASYYIDEEGLNLILNDKNLISELSDEQIKVIILNVLKESENPENTILKLGKYGDMFMRELESNEARYLNQEKGIKNPKGFESLLQKYGLIGQRGF